MTSKLIGTTRVLAFSLWLATVTTAAAQHHGAPPHHGAPSHHGVPTHRPRISINLVAPHGRPVAQHHHDQYVYVVPPTRQHGAYYTYENSHYYTPPAPPMVVGRPQLQVAQRPVQVEFGAFTHYLQLAERLDTLANEFCLDLHHNYQHNPNYAEVYREAYQFLQAAKFMHGSEHRGDREAIRRSGTNIDNLFHHVQAEVKNWTRVERRAIGQLGTLAKLEELEALIHHLLFDLGVKADHDQPEQAPPPGPEIAPPPPPNAPPRNALPPGPPRP